MEKQINVALSHFQKLREKLITELKGLSLKDYYTIPPGFNNNLIWQAGHILATQQIFHYKLTGQTPRVDPDIIERYKNGTKPEHVPNSEDLEILVNHLQNTVVDLKADVAANRMNSFTSYTTGFGVEITNISEAISFNNIHEALHLGRVSSMKQMIQKFPNNKKPLPFS